MKIPKAAIGMAAWPNTEEPYQGQIMALVYDMRFGCERMWVLLVQDVTTPVCFGYRIGFTNAAYGTLMRLTDGSEVDLSSFSEIRPEMPPPARDEVN